MASYHFSAQIIKRSEGRSAVAAAAYRAGERLQDERAEKVQDYSQRQGVVHSEIMLPEGADERLADRETLWNEVEGMERRKDAQLAREINVALPHELTDEQRLELVQDFVQEEFVDRGMVADIAIHAPQPEQGDHEHNHHAHIMLTLRQVDENGLRKIKTREWNSDAMMLAWRKSWAAFQNRDLERYGHEDRVDHRTLKEQRQEALERGDRVQAEVLDREPEIHVGPKARQMARQGYKPESQDRELPVYGENRSERQYRTRHYSQTDQGSRTDYNQTIMDRNRRRAANRVTKYRAREARFRQKQRYWGQKEQWLQEATGTKPFYDPHDMKIAKRWLEWPWKNPLKYVIAQMAKVESQNARRQENAKWDFIKQRKAAWEATQHMERKQRQGSFFIGPSLKHAKKRQGLLSLLLADVGKALAQAVGAQNLLEGRYQDYGHRYGPQTRQPARSQARGRTRTRGLFPGSA